MKLNRISWTAIFFISIISFTLWLKFSYPQLAFTNFSIDRAQAVHIAEDYLRNKQKADISRFQTASIFGMDRQMDRYLQKTIGFDGLKKFIEEHGYSLFFWKVRFFKENEKEEYQLVIDTATGEVIGYSHIIDENAARPMIDKETAHREAEEFLTRTFGFQAEQYTLRSNLSTIRDYRTDHLFSWQKKTVSIPWNNDKNSGTGKLISSVNMTGGEILSFSQNTFLVPDQFNRDIDGQREWGRNIMAGIKIIVLALLTSAVFFIVVRQNHLVMHITKKFYTGMAAIFFALSLLSALNQFQHILYSYKTTLSMSAYLWRNGINIVIGALFSTIAVLIPCLSGELLRHETSPQKKGGSFLHYIQSTFASRQVSELIVLGYFVSIIMLGVQSLLVQMGQEHLGVWVEHNWMNNTTTSYLPFLAAFTIGYQAAFSEEIMYRLYAINLGKKIFSKLSSQTPGVKLFIICLLSSLIWGFAHSNYPIFPMWFRGLEMTCLGLLLSYVYLNFGLIPVLVAHYLFDVFWSCANYIFGISNPFYYCTSIFVLMLPLIIAGIIFILNRRVEERPLRWQLNKHQQYNLNILTSYLKANAHYFKAKPLPRIKEEITSHGWDPAVVDVAVDDAFKGN